MSQFLGGGGGMGIITPNDERIEPVAWYFASDMRVVGPNHELQSFQTGWWPGCAGLLGDQSADGVWPEAIDWDVAELPGGASSRYGVAGITRDQYGTAVPGVTVNLFRTSDNQLLSTAVSDTLGYYICYTTYYPDAHYVVAYKAGSPDIQGTSVNTLIGA